MKTKPTKPIKKWTPVEVTWIDIFAENSAIKTEDFVKNYRPCIRKTLGYVIFDGEHYFSTCSTDDRNSQVDEDADCAIVYPRAAVLEIRVLK